MCAHERVRSPFQGFQRLAATARAHDMCLRCVLANRVFREQLPHGAHFSSREFLPQLQTARASPLTQKAKLFSNVRRDDYEP